ncbi:hypothetical protein E3N88_06994 [Mikania micrantha]|uniref:Uncharacterized protein n=1 Tax=Mikania micrantha TaxID=192012 RepID=A0A5N6PQB4_9ASTR|nr:hypothetical protein E3N88_06994 [Mikania micrantha]
MIPRVFEAVRQGPRYGPWRYARLGREKFELSETPGGKPGMLHPPGAMRTSQRDYRMDNNREQNLGKRLVDDDSTEEDRLKMRGMLPLSDTDTTCDNRSGYLEEELAYTDHVHDNPVEMTRQAIRQQEEMAAEMDLMRTRMEHVEEHRAATTTAVQEAGALIMVVEAAPRGSAGLPSTQVEGPRGAVGGLPCPSQAESRPPSRTVCQAVSRAEPKSVLVQSGYS